MLHYYEDMTTNELKDLLRKWRENNERKSIDIMEFWKTIIDDIDKLGNEQYVILEQILHAALDTHEHTVACRCIVMLYKKFPGSLRVAKLRVMLREAEENYDEALEMLDEILKADETNSAARKRRVTILKAQGLIPEAIKELVDYLKKFMSDVEAWQELCNLYQQMGEYSRAAFCAEELILHQPHNHLMHQLLADIRYTMGGIENMELAKTYYCQSLKLNPDNMRSLLGLFLATNNLLNHYKSSGNSSKRKEVWRLCQWAQSTAASKKNSSDNIERITQTMLNLAINE